MENEKKLPSVLNNIVSTSNQAARSAQGFTLREKRVFMCGLSKMDTCKRGKPLTLAERTLRVTAADYAELSKLTHEKDAYRDLKAACDNLFNRYIRFKIKTPLGVKERKFRWVSGVTYHEGEGYVEFAVSEEVMPYVASLDGLFTSYRLRQASELRSLYSWRMLELLTSHTNDVHTEKQQRLTLDDLRQALEIPESYLYNDIKKRVILPALKELIQKDGWVIKWKPVKKGKGVYAIDFTFMKDKQADLFKS